MSIRVEYSQGRSAIPLWPQVLDYVERACDETLTPNDVYRDVLTNQAILWLVYEESELLAVAATTIQGKNGVRWLDVTTIGGRDWPRWSQSLQQDFERYMKQEGLRGMSACVRRGLVKPLKRLGWRERQVRMEWRNGH